MSWITLTVICLALLTFFVTYFHPYWGTPNGAEKKEEVKLSALAAILRLSTLHFLLGWVYFLLETTYLIILTVSLNLISVIL